jgi:hypothetical protein
MKWPTIDELSVLMPLPRGFRYEQLGRASVAPLIEALKNWHPAIAVGASSCFLREDFYQDRVCLDGEIEKNILVVQIKVGDELGGMWSVEREIEALAIYARLIVVAPAHRGTKLAVLTSMGSENVSRSMGAQFQYGLATFKFPHVQRAFEHADYRLLGIFPGYGREEIAPGVVKRVYEAVYAKLLVPEEEVHLPDPKNMTPKTKALFDLLFPE